MPGVEQSRGRLDDYEHASRQRIFLLPEVSLHHRQNADAPLGPRHHVQGAGDSLAGHGRKRIIRCDARRQAGDIKGRSFKMIGVIADPHDLPVVREFFELFKTPWEPYARERKYDILLCFGDRDLRWYEAPTVVVYSGARSLSPANASDQVAGQHSARVLRYKDERLPLYCGGVTFA